MDRVLAEKYYRLGFEHGREPGGEYNFDTIYGYDATLPTTYSSYDAYDNPEIGCRRQTSESHKKKTKVETIGYVPVFHPDCEYLTKHPYDLDKHQRTNLPSYPSPTAQKINTSAIRSMTSQKREVLARHPDYYVVFMDPTNIKPNANTT